MRRTVAVVCLLSVLTLARSAGLAQTPNDEFNGDIRRLLYLLDTDRIASQMIGQFVEQWKTAYPDVPAEFWERLGSEFKSEEIIDLAVPVYARHLSHRDIVVLLNFFESPVGRNFVRAQGPIQEELYSAGQIWGVNVLIRFVEKLKQESQPQN